LKRRERATRNFLTVGPSFSAMKLIALAVAASLGAAAHSPKDVKRDCAKHGGALTRAYSAKTLRQAAGRYPGCAVGIRSQLAGRVGKRGDKRASSVLRDCAHHGRLTRRYRASTLRSALKRMPADMRDYTSCRAALRSQLSLFRRS
jgi:hypothetical protein